MFRKLLSITTIGFCMASVVQSQSSENLQARVPALVRSFFAAEQKYDTPALAKLISKNFVEVSPAGEMDAHDRFLGFYTPDKKADWPPMTISDDHVREFGNTVIDILKITYTMKAPDGTTRPMEIRATFVAGLEDGQYKLLSSQFTGIRPSVPSK